MSVNTTKKRELWVRLIEVSPGYANYQKRTSRKIPMVILPPIDEREETR